MLLKYIEIACKNLGQCRDVFLSKYSFALISQQNKSCLLKNNSVNLMLSEKPTNMNRVVNISFTHPDVSQLQCDLSSRGFRTSNVQSNCKFYHDNQYFDVQSPFPHIKHRIYQDQGVGSNKQVANISDAISATSSLLDIDHLLFCSPKNLTKQHSQWYSNLLGLQSYTCQGSNSDGIEVVVNGSGMKMVASKRDSLPIFAFSEPIIHTKTKYNQIERYLTANGGGGLQHLAFSTNDIFATVSDLRERGMQIIQQPASYYNLPEKQDQFEHLAVDPQLAFENSVIIDQDLDGYLLQVFTQSLFDEDGMFIEIIERRGSRGFGQGNVKALFSALQDTMADPGKKLQPESNDRILENSKS